MYSHYVPFSQAFVKQIINMGVTNYLKKCDHVVTPTESIRQMLIDYGVRGPITAVPTGIDLRPYQAADGEAIRSKYGWGKDKVLISVGRMAPEKNWTTLLDAVSQVCKQIPNLRLVLLGSGPQVNELEAYTEKLRIKERVTFVGLVPMDEVPSYLKAADLFVFASISETQGLVTMEAMSAGLPVVAVDATGTSDEVTDGEQGLLTENDSEALAQAILRVLTQPTLYEQLQVGASRKAQSFDIMTKAQEMLGVYTQAIEDKRANRYMTVND
jgi:glycosyltransferase involved in cell wall biosynthesis